MNDVIMISVPMARYEELVKLEEKINLIKEMCEREPFAFVTGDDFKYYLGIKAEGKSDEIS